MPSRESTLPQAAQPQPSFNAGLHSAVWTRIMLFLMKIIPAPVCLLLIWPFAFVFFVLAGSKRRAVQSNLMALRPWRGRWGSWADSYEVFRQFALVYFDRLWHLHFGRAVEWEIIGGEVFEKLREKKEGGALVFTIHSGNYDIGASLFAERFGRPLHIVRVPERSQSLHEVRAAELREEERRNPNLRVHYNQAGDHLGLELYRLLAAGEVVAIQGDRVVMDVSSTEVTVEGATFRIPRGPFVLAEMAHVPCYPVFLTRVGFCVYRIEMREPFLAGGQRVKSGEIAQSWVDVMHRFILQHWDQWLVFEELVTRAAAEKND